MTTLPDDAFADLRRLSDCFARVSIASTDRMVARIARRLGATAVPLLGRELRHASGGRRELARNALAILAATAVRPRVLDELRGVVCDDQAGDEAKVCALGLLAELGEQAAARFSDPGAIQRRSALALAAQLESAADVASAADLMVHQLADTDVIQMLEILVEAAPAAAHRLATELACRLDVELAQRDRIRALVTTAAPPESSPRAVQPTHVAVLVDAAARIVVVVSRKFSKERRWRRWAVLIGATGHIEDCLHEDDARPLADGTESPADGLIANLCADGYRVASSDVDHARTVVAAAVRRSARAADSRQIGSGYYLGRDLLELGDAHVIRTPDHDTGSALARAHELLATGDATAAQLLLDHETAEDPAVAGALGACLLVQGDLAASVVALERAIAGDPAWPLHHWNLAVAAHRLADHQACYHALRRFIATSAAPTGLYGDLDQPGRVACAERMLAELERAARLTGRSLARRRKKRART
ncbi:MAG: hypothetical protein ABI867_14095 [Kofleriaceae bacterium]